MGDFTAGLLGVPQRRGKYEFAFAQVPQGVLGRGQPRACRLAVAAGASAAAVYIWWARAWMSLSPTETSTAGVYSALARLQPCCSLGFPKRLSVCQPDAHKWPSTVGRID